MVNLQSGGLEEASLRGANLSRANLQATGLDGADLTNVAGLTWTQLNKALLDTKTVLPLGLIAPDNK